MVMAVCNPVVFSQLLTEFIGTFFLVFTIIMSDNRSPIFGSPGPSPEFVGFTLMVLVYMGGHLSGAHYNPAVTLGVTLRGACEKHMAVYYVIVQFIAGIVAALIGDAIVPYEPLLDPSPAKDYNAAQAFFIEALWTFLLVLVVLNVATAKKTDKNSYFGLAIGMTVGAGIWCFGDLSGSVFNPAVAVGLTFVANWYKGQTLKNIWIYLIAHPIGAILAAYTFKFQHPAEFDLMKTDPEMGSMPREPSIIDRAPLLPQSDDANLQ